MEMNLTRIFYLLLTRLKYIVLVAVIAGLASFGYTNYFITEMYTSSAKFLVLMEQGQNKVSEHTFAQESISSYMAIFKARDFFNQVVDIYNENNEDSLLTTSQLMSITSIQASSNSEEPTFTIKVTSSDPDISYEITQLISDYAVTKVNSIEMLNEIMMVESPIKSFVPSSPNVKNNTLLGFLIGGFLSATFIILKEFFDGRIKNVEDVKLICKIPILGVVPDTNAESNESNSIKKLKKVLHRKEEGDEF